MSTAAIGGASVQLTAVMAAAALQENSLGIAEAQVSLSEETGGAAAPPPDPSPGAGGGLVVYA